MTFKNVRTVTVEYDDGEIETFNLTEDAGYYREQMTYEEASDNHRIEHVIRTHEVFWAERMPFNVNTGQSEESNRA